MSIIFHCEHCNKKIEAKDSAGGKFGQCPACHNKLYIPDLNADDGLTLAPLDEQEEEKKKRLMAETFKLNQDILSQREDAVEGGGAGGVAFEVSEKELTKNIINYLRQMANGDLDQAEQIVKAIIPYGSKAKAIIDQIALSEIPEPELADVPQQVLSGLIRTLRSKTG